MSSLLHERLARGPIVADGAMGTMLYQHGVSFAESFDALNLSRASLIESVHREYLAAGATLIETNTFGANAIRLAPHGLEEQVRTIARAGVKVARAAREVAGIDALVAGSVGPLGKPLEPFGHITVADAERCFAATVEGLLEGGCDCFILETFQDLNEILAALRAVRGLTLDVPVIAQMTFGDDGKTFYGHTPALAIPMLRQAGATVVGINCGLGPQPTLEVLEEIVRAAEDTPVSAMPNAGLPRMVDGRYLYL